MPRKTPLNRRWLAFADVLGLLPYVQPCCENASSYHTPRHRIDVEWQWERGRAANVNH
jgi:hypothetical protein